MADLSKIVDDLSSLTVLEAAELSKLLEEKWGVSAAAPVAVAAAGGAAAAAAPVEEKTEFDVVLTAAGDKKINVIKEVRAITGIGPEGGEGPRGGRPEDGEGSGGEGRSREHQEEARGSRRQGRTQVGVCRVRPGALDVPGRRVGQEARWRGRSAPLALAEASGLPRWAHVGRAAFRTAVRKRLARTNRWREQRQRRR